MATGTVRQVIGTVVDIEFPAGDLPQIYNAVNIRTDTDRPLPGKVFFYLVRAGHHCGSGTLGSSTDGPRTGAVCRP